MSAGIFAVAADAILVLHVAFVVFVIGGQILILHGWRVGWSWTRNALFRLTHLVVVVFVVLETWLNFACPLTILENWLRVSAGQTVYEDIGCIAHWLQKLLFYAAPSWMFDLVYTAFALAVLVSFALYPPRGNIGWKRRSNRAE